MPLLQISLVRAAASALIWLTLLSVASAQLIPSNLPACAQTCAVLQQAQTSCESNPAAEGTCFCESALLTTLKDASATNICPAQCSDADFQTIYSWYKSVCANGGVGLNPATTLTVVTATATAGGAAASTPAAATTAPAAGGDPADEADSGQTGSEWWATHWNWVVMLIVLALAFTAIGIVGTCLFKRHKRKRDGIIAANPRERQAPVGEWAPSRHSVHDFAAGTPTQNINAITPMPPVNEDVQTYSGNGKGKEVVGRDGVVVSAKRLRKSII